MITSHSERSTEITRLLNAGLSAEQIANKCEIKQSTVRRYIRFIKSRFLPKKEVTKNPKILLLDIETLPCLATIWGIYEQRIPAENILRDWFILSWSAKYLYSGNMMSDVLTSEEVIKNEDKRLLGGIWELINESDIIIGQNLKKFDLRKLNARFIINKFPPPLPYQTIDTLTECRKYFAFTSYKLDYINKILGLRRKVGTSYELWLKCLTGDPESLKQMEVYNRQDVLILEDLYTTIRGWLKSGPNLGLYYDTDGASVCPNCGSTSLEWKGYYYTGAGRFKSGRCNNCTAVFRSRYSDLSKEEKKSLLSTIAR
uniref:Putative RNase_H superfamily protein n=1 Tax=viral metagenome TaxID=1070528 RepID=A0A6M3XLT7_9ZZZZ